MVNMANTVNKQPYPSYQPTLMPSTSAVRNFGHILDRVHPSIMSRFASNIRKSGHPSTNSTGDRTTHSSSKFIPCVVHPKVMNGTYNIAFELQFTDGVRWILKVPMDGYADNFKPLNQKALVSEARTILFLKAETTIPVPTVYAFDTSTDNELGLAFILMEKMQGVPAWHVWDSEPTEVPNGKREQHRARIVHDVAAAMVQLNKFTFDQGGALVFDDDGKVTGLGELKQDDGVGLWDGIPENDPRFRSRHVWAAKGATTDPKSFYLFTLDRLVNGVPVSDDPSFKGTIKLLRLFIDWACEHTNITGKKFVLAHPDLDLQNILVTEDGTVTGFIDWDGTAAVPREMGCALYPNWLMRDWVAETWHYQIVRGELDSYRAMYAQYMEVEIERRIEGSCGLQELKKLARQEADITRLSALFKHLERAGNFPDLTKQLVRDFLKAAISDTAAEWDGVDEDDLTECESECESDGGTEGDDQGLAAYEIGAKSAKEDEFNEVDYLAEADVEMKGRELPDHLKDMDAILDRLRAPPVYLEPSATCTLSDTKAEPEQRPTSDNDPDEQVLTSPQKAGFLQLFCDLSAKVLKLSAEALHQKNLKESKVNLLNHLKQQHWEKADMLLACLRDRIQQPIATLHYNTIENIKAPEEGIPAPTELADVQVEGVKNTEVPEEEAVELSDDSHAVSKHNLETLATTPLEIPNSSLEEEINEIRARRSQLLTEANEKKKATKKAEKVAHEKEVREVWEDIACNVGNRGIAIRKIRDNRALIVASILNTIEVEEMREAEAAFVPVIENEAEVEHPSTFKVPEESSGESDSHGGSHTSPANKSENAASHTPASTAPSGKGSANHKEKVQKSIDVIDGNGNSYEASKATRTADNVDLEKEGHKLMALIGANGSCVYQNGIAISKPLEQTSNGAQSDASNTQLVNEASVTISKPDCEATDQKLKNPFGAKDDGTNILDSVKAALKLPKSRTVNSKPQQDRAAIREAPKQTAGEFPLEVADAKVAGMPEPVIKQLQDQAQELKDFIGVPPKKAADTVLNPQIGNPEPGIHGPSIVPNRAAMPEPGKQNASKIEAEISNAAPVANKTLMTNHNVRGSKLIIRDHQQENDGENLNVDPNHTPKAAKSGGRKARAAAPPAYTPNGKLIPRNKPCPCGSRIIFKWCCGKKQKVASAPGLANNVDGSNTKVSGGPKMTSQNIPFQGNHTHAGLDMEASTISDLAILAISFKGNSPQNHVETTIPAELPANISPPPGISGSVQAENQAKWETFWSQPTSNNQHTFTAAEKGKGKDPALYPANPTPPPTPPDDEAATVEHDSPQQDAPTTMVKHPAVGQAARQNPPILPPFPLPPPSNHSTYDIPTASVNNDNSNNTAVTTDDAAAEDDDNNNNAGDASNNNDDFVDDGTFTESNILNILGRDGMQLDELRVLRLKMGFLMVMQGM